VVDRRARRVRISIELFESGAEVPDELLLGTLFGQLYDPEALTDDARVLPWIDELLAEPEWEDPGRVNQWRAYAGYRADPAALARVAALSLVVVFERDLIMPPPLAREVADAIPEGRYVKLSQLGHWGMILDPARTHRIALEFLREAGAAPRA
jgi:pimeloyl-ACP methyl ester carboxylesterase